MLIVFSCGLRFLELWSLLLSSQISQANYMGFFVCFVVFSFLQSWPLIWDVWKIFTGSGLFSEVSISSPSSLLNLGYVEIALTGKQEQSQARIFGLAHAAKLLLYMQCALICIQVALSIHGFCIHGYGGFDCIIPFYIKDLSIRGFWYLQGVLEPIHHRYWEITVFSLLVYKLLKLAKHTT